MSCRDSNRLGSCSYVRKSGIDLSKNELFYPEICDGYLHPAFSNWTETDETNCHTLWPCETRTSRCNGIWNCKNGRDELNCPQQLSDCGKSEHYCAYLVKMS